MAILNIGSVILYIVAFTVSKKREHQKFFHLINLEVTLHAALSVLIIGKTSGFSIYCVAIIPLAYFCYYGLALEKQEEHFYPFCYSVLAVAIFAILQLWNYEPFYSLDPKISTTLAIMNYGITLFATIFFIIAFIIQILSLQEKLMSQNSTLEILSMTDALTGLSNRRIITEFEQDAIANGTLYCVILADIDDFKKINDTYGHNFGDCVLVTASNLFRQEIRKNDIVCRWGGEEFLIILPFCDLENAERVATKIREKICSTVVDFESTHVHFRMTFGISESTEGQTIEDTIQIADHYLYYGKRHGKNQVVSCRSLKQDKSP
ncbi:MAG: GGDEF domain-containing protein [Lachnospiraceae bacterium]